MSLAGVFRLAMSERDLTDLRARTAERLDALRSRRTRRRAFFAGWNTLHARPRR